LIHKIVNDWLLEYITLIGKEMDEKMKSAQLTEHGVKKVEKILKVDNLYEKDFDTLHHIENALRARSLFLKDREYVVKEDQVIIVDEFTGRLMPGRRWSGGLHQAIEAKGRSECAARIFDFWPLLLFKIISGCMIKLLE